MTEIPNKLCFANLRDFVTNNLPENLIYVQCLLTHPKFWSKKCKVEFILEFSDFMDFRYPNYSINLDSDQYKEKEKINTQLQNMIGMLCECGNWSSHLDKVLPKPDKNFRQQTIPHLLKYISGTWISRKSWGKEMKAQFLTGNNDDDDSEQFIQYFENQFQFLIPVAFQTAREYLKIKDCDGETLLKSYYCSLHFSNDFEFPTTKTNDSQISQLIKINFCVKPESPAEAALSLLENHPTLKTQIETMDFETGLGLYTQLVNKWEEYELKSFLTHLENLKEGKLFANLCRKKFHILQRLQPVLAIKAHEDEKRIIGQYKGINPKIESIARELVHMVVASKSIATDKDSDLFEHQKYLLKRFQAALEKGTLWWNKREEQITLPSNFVPRMVRSHANGKAEDLYTVIKSENDRTLILLVDSPKTGKSVALTKLQQQLEEEIPQRIVLRLNCKEMENKCKPKETTASYNITWFLKTFASEVPFNKLTLRKRNSIPLYIFLDDFDKVLPSFRNEIDNIIWNLLSIDHKSCRNIFVKTIVITTRPLMDKTLKQMFQFGVRYSLVPFREEEQMSFMQKEINSENFTLDDAWETLNYLPKSIRGEMNWFLLISNFINEAHKLNEEDSIPSEINRSESSLINLQPSMIKLYNYLALKEYLYLSLDEIVSRGDTQTGPELFRKPHKDEFEYLISFGLVEMEEDEIYFKQRIFADFFCARLLVDGENTPHDLRNILFANTDKSKSDIAKFVFNILPGENITNIVSKGWTKWILNVAHLSHYQDDTGVLLDHILSNAIDYETECVKKNKVLVRDSCNNGLFIKWINSKFPTNQERLREILLYQSMNEVIAALVLAGPEDCREDNISTLLKFLNEEEIKTALMNCSSLIQIAIQRRHNELSQNLYFESLYERLERWLTPGEIAIALKSGLKLETRWVTEKFFSSVLTEIKMCIFFPQIFSKKEITGMISNEETRITDVVGKSMHRIHLLWGEEFLLPCLLKFRFQFGSNKGKSIFFNPHILQNDLLAAKVFDEIEANIRDAIKVIKDDGGFGLIRNLEMNILKYNCKEACKIEEASKEQDSRKFKLLSSVIEKLGDESMANFGISNVHQLSDFIAYGKLESESRWEEGRAYNIKRVSSKDVGRFRGNN